MHLLVCVLNHEEHLDEILEGFLELGIGGATIIDSMGMGRILTYEVPIFAGLRSLLSGARPYNKTIFTVLHDDQVEPAITLLEDICGSFDHPGTGIIFTIPIDRVKGIAKEVDEP